MASYIFDPSKGETPETVAHRRKLSDALAARIFGRAPQNAGEGLSAIGQAWIARTMLDEADAAQKAGRSSGDDAFSRITGMMTGTPEATGSVPNAGASPMGNLPSMPNRVYSENEFNPIDAQVATPEELAAGVPAPKQYASLIGKAAVDNDLPPELLAAQIKQESGFNPKAVSPAGALGISQFMPGTAKEMGVNPLDPASAIPGGARYLRQNIDRFGGSVPLGLAAYNAGPGRVQQSGGDISKLPAETQGYVKNITGAAPVHMAQAGPSTQDLIAASTNPWLTESQRSVVNTMLKQRLEQEQQASDPLRQLQIKKAQADLEYGKSPESVREYEYAKKNGYEGSFQDWIASKRAGAGEYGLNAIWGRGPDGKPAIIQLGKGGKPILTPMPEGFQPNKDAEKIDLGTHWGILDPTTRTMVSTIPKDIRGEKREAKIGEGEGEAAVSLESINSKMPGLEAVVEKLGTLSNKATYTLTGQGMNWGMRQLGFEPSEAAVARSDYISMVDNQVLPLLRDTFGAAFTQKEGETLRNTLGDPDKSPKEKKAVLKSFIEQKRRDVEALQRRVNGQGKTPSKPGGNTTSSGVTWSVE